VTLKKTTFRTAKNVVGSSVRAIRLRQRFPVSQDDLAGRVAARGISIDRFAIGKIELGKRYVLDYEVLAIAKALKVPVEVLYKKRPV
jgi:hypothetical protein